MPIGFQPAAPEPGTIGDGNGLKPELIVTLALTSVVTTVFTTARLIANRSIGGSRVDDYLSGLTWLLYMGYVAINSIQTHFGIGQHVWNIDPASAPLIAQTSWAIQLLYCILTPTAKAALLYQIQRIFAPASYGAVYIMCQILVWQNCFFYLGTFVAILVQCVPQRRIWDPSITTGRCFNPKPLLIITGGFNVLNDTGILLLPFWAIWHLNISTKHKLGVAGVFVTGLLAVTSSICRLVYTLSTLHSNDTSYLFARVALWSMAELTSIILCTCFPLMPRFVRLVINTMTSRARQLSSADSQEPKTPLSRLKSSSVCQDCKYGATCGVHEEAGESDCERQHSQPGIQKIVRINMEIEGR